MIIIVLGLESSFSISKSVDPCFVSMPISMIPVTAISNLQNSSSPHNSLACCSNSAVANVVSNIGTKLGS